MNKISNFIKNIKKDNNDKENDDGTSNTEKEKDNHKIKFEYYYLKEFEIIGLRAQRHFMSAINNLYLNKDYSTSIIDDEDFEEKCKRIFDDAENKAKEYAEKVKKENKFELEKEQAESLCSSKVILRSHMKNIMYKSEDITDNIKIIQDNLNSVDESIKESERHLNDFLQKMSKYEEELKKNKEYASSDFEPTRKYGESGVDTYNKYIKFVTYKIKCANNDIQRFKDVTIYYINICQKLFNAAQFNKTEYEKLKAIYDKL